MLRYYALRASSAYSSGAHDEWKIFVRINRRRLLGERVPRFFDGRLASQPEMETDVAPGYDLQSVDRILRRPHVAAMVEDFRKLASAHGLSVLPLSLQEFLSATSARPRRDDNQ